MKILHVITDLKIGGESKHLVRVVSFLRTFEHVVSCLTLTSDPEGAPRTVRAELEALDVPVVDLGVSPDKPLSAVRAFLRLQRLVRREEPSILHSTLIHANLLSQPLAWRGRPVICSHVVTNPWLRNWQRTLERYIGKRAIFLANARAVAEILVEAGLDPERIRVLYYGVDCDHFCPEGPSANLAGAEVLLGVGRLHPQKGFDDLIRAAALLPGQPEVVLVGDGPLRAPLSQRAQDLGVRLTIVTAVRDVAPYLRRASAVVLPSLYEGLPNVLLEALATGCAVVATDLPGHQEVIRDGETGILVPPYDVPALARAIQRALSDDGSLGAEGRNAMLEHFRWEACIERRRLLYESVAAHAA